MKKLILPFFLLLIGVYCGYYLVMENFPPTEMEPAGTNLVLRVSEDGKALDCTVAFMAEGSGEPLSRSLRQTQHLSFLSVPEGTDYLLINYSAGSGNFKDAQFPLEHEPGNHFKMTIDPTRETVEYNISFKDYLLGFPLGQGPLQLLLYLYRAVLYYILWIVFPFIWLITAYTLFREYQKGLRRRYAGSWVYFGIGCAGILFVRMGTGFFGWLAAWPELLRVAFWFGMLGYPLYFVAYLVLDERKVLGAEYRLLDEYFTYEEYQLSDGGIANGFVSAWQERGIAGVLGWIIGALLLPVFTYARLILYFVTPFMYRSRTWEELTPLERPENPAIFAKLQSVTRKKEEHEETTADTMEETSEEDAAAAPHNVTTVAIKRRKRKRHRPQRKAPYEDQEAENDEETSRDEAGLRHT